MSSSPDVLYCPDMPFMNRLIDSAHRTRASKRQRRTYPAPSDREMAFFAPAPTHHLAPPSSLARKHSDRHASRNELEDYLESEDLELSFASNVSLNSPPLRHSGLPDSDAMDISPMPPPKAKFASGILASKGAPRTRSLATQNSRLFGSDLSNTNSVKAVDAPPSKTGTASNRKLARPALPTDWMSAMRPPPEPQTVPTQPSSPVDDAMDVDTSYIMEAPPVIAPSPTNEGFNNLFFDTLSPRRSLDSPLGPTTKKRRSLSPEGSPAMLHAETSSPMPPSPSVAKLDRLVAAGRTNIKPGLQGLGAPSASFIKRPRRPVLSEVVHTGPGSGIQSAYPLLSAGLEDEGQPASSAPPVRRAFSALLPPSMFLGGESEGDSSFDAEESSPAQAYAKRQHVKTIRRCDGTEDFRPLTGATAMVMKESPVARTGLSPGIPRFGDIEANGKILPCHRVSEDGLMRITPQTLDNLLDGKYNDRIRDFHIIDCRFDYEYNGGHIKGAVNINTTAAVEELLLGPSLTKPKPSVSGDGTAKTILVFHCEFSAKRAPTFAKHLRSKDRAMNNHNYPKIHYPEVYILEGGYCQYFKTAGHRCDPPAYVTMDDPNHATSRREDLDQFRNKTKFGRHKSYAYGDGPMKTLSQQGSKRNTAPNLLFAAAATAARSRRSGSVSLMTLQEDANTTADAEHDDTDTDLGDSPCPPPNKVASFKLKGKPLRGLVRAETYNPVRMLS